MTAYRSSAQRTHKSPHWGLHKEATEATVNREITVTLDAILLKEK